MKLAVWRPGSKAADTLGFQSSQECAQFLSRDDSLAFQLEEALNECVYGGMRSQDLSDQISKCRAVWQYIVLDTGVGAVDENSRTHFGIRDRVLVVWNTVVVIVGALLPGLATAADVSARRAS